MRRSIALAVVSLSALPLLACGGGDRAAALKQNLNEVAAAIASGDASPVPNPTPGRATVAETVLAYTASLNGNDPVASFGFNCVADQAAGLLTHDLAYWTTGKPDAVDPLSPEAQSSAASQSAAPSPSNSAAKAATYTIQTLAETKAHVVPLVINNGDSSLDPVLSKTNVDLIQEKGLWCISYMGNWARENEDGDRAQTRDHLAELLVDWTKKNPTLAVPPAVMDAQAKAATFYIDKTKDFSLWVGRGNHVVLTSTAPAAAGGSSYCFAVTNIGSNNPQKALVFNSAKGGEQPAGATC